MDETGRIFPLDAYNGHANFPLPPGATPGAPLFKKNILLQDPNAPKRTPTSFFLFIAEVRSKIKETWPEIATKDVARKAGEMWKALSEEEKKVRMLAICVWLLLQFTHACAPVCSPTWKRPRN